MTGFGLKHTQEEKGIEIGGLVSMQMPSGLQITNDSTLEKVAAHQKGSEKENIMRTFVGIERDTKHGEFPATTNCAPAGGQDLD